MIGSMALSLVESSPTLISRLISRPTERKKIAIRKSFIICPKDRECPPWLKKLNSPIDRDTGICHKEKYQFLMQGILAQKRASTVKIINTMLELTYLLNLLKKL
jgi:hypothetical protein